MKGRNHQQPIWVRALAKCVLACAWLGTLAAGGSALADPADPAFERRVLLVVDRANDPLLDRIRAEVVALGLGVSSRSSSGPLEADAREQRAVAAIRVLPSRKGVEVWMADATTGRTLARQLVVDERPEGPDHGLVALQTAEILRTGLFPKNNTSRPTPPPPPPLTVVPPDQPSTSPPSSGGAAMAGLGGVWSLGGAGTALQAWISLAQTWRRGLGFALDVSGPVRRASLSGPEGDAKVAAFMAGVAVFASLRNESSPWFLTAGAGAAVLNLRAEGRSSSSYPMLEASSSSAVTGAAYARIEAGFRPVRWARLGLAAIAGTTFEKISIRFAGNQAGSWGSVFLGSLLLVGVEWE